MTVEMGPSQVFRLHRKFGEFGQNTDYRCGEIYSFVAPNPEYPVYPEGFFAQTPVTFALIKFNGNRMGMYQLTDYYSEPRIGEKVEMVTRKLFETKDGLIIYGPKYRPVLERT